MGLFKPIHPEKYNGNLSELIFKSGLEQKMMRYLDRSPNILRWSYERLTVKYMDMTSDPPRVRNYYIDFVAHTKNGKQIWIEVKSSDEVKEPKKEKRIEYKTWVKNQCKWKSARLLAESKGCQFKIITEQELN